LFVCIPDSVRPSPTWPHYVAFPAVSQTAIRAFNREGPISSHVFDFFLTAGAQRNRAGQSFSQLLQIALNPNHLGLNVQLLEDPHGRFGVAHPPARHPRTPRRDVP